MEHATFSRIRLVFDGFFGENVRKCWHLVDPIRTPTVNDLKHQVKERYELANSMHFDFILDDFELPAIESTKIFKDGDLVRYVLSS